MTHPSFLELDVFAVSAGSAAQGPTAAHVQGCQQCAAHVAAVRVPAPFPSALLEPVRSAPPTTPWLVRALFAFASLVLVVAVAGIVKFVAQPRSDTTPKGLPAAALWLKRGDAVTPWKQGERLSLDSAVRWEIAPAGFTHVRVYDARSNEVLFEAKVSGDAPVLTPAWTFDGARDTETIRVVLSRDDAPPRTGGSCTGDDGQQWCFEYVLQLEPR